MTTAPMVTAGRSKARIRLRLTFRNALSLARAARRNRGRDWPWYDAGTSTPDGVHFPIGQAPQTEGAVGVVGKEHRPRSGVPLEQALDQRLPGRPGVADPGVDPRPPQPHPRDGGPRPATAQPGEGVPARQAGLRAGGDETAADELDGQAEVVRQSPRGADQGRLRLDTPGVQ